MMEIKRMKTPKQTKLLYFLGKFIFALFVGVEMYYFSAYLTDAALLPVGIVALVLNIPTVVDLIFSFLNGVILEKLPVPMGKYRFWLTVGPIVATITYAIAFVRIKDDWACGIMIIIMTIIAHFTWSLAETALNALPALVTDDVEERSSLSMLFGTAANWSGALFGLIGMPIILFYNNITASKTMGYMLMVLTMGVLYIISFVLLGLNIKDAEAEDARRKAAAGGEKKAKGPTIGEMLSNITKNGPLIAILLYFLLFFTTMFTQTGMMYYYFTYVLAAPAAMGLTMTLRGFATVLTTFIYGPIMKLFKGNKRNVVVFGTAVNAIYMLAMWAIRPSVTVFMVVSIVCSVFGGLCQMPGIALYADCATYGEWKTGADCKGFVMALYNVPLKIGLTLKSAILAVVLGLIHYDATITDPAVVNGYINGFNNGYLLLGAVLTIVSILVLVLGYRLTESKVAQCVTEIEGRKAEKTSKN